MHSLWVRQLCGEIWFPPLSSRWKLYWAGHVGKFWKIPNLPFSFCICQQFPADSSRPEDREESLGARSSQRPNIYFRSPFLLLKRLLGIRRNVVCRCSEPLASVECCAKEQSSVDQSTSLCVLERYSGGENGWSVGISAAAPHGEDDGSPWSWHWRIALYPSFGPEPQGWKERNLPVRKCSQFKNFTFQVTGRMMMPSTFSCRCYDQRWGGDQHSAGPF